MTVTTIHVYQTGADTVHVGLEMEIKAINLFSAVSVVKTMLWGLEIPPNASVSEPAAPTSTSTEQSSPATKTTHRRRRTAAEMEADNGAENPTSGAAQTAPAGSDAPAGTSATTGATKTEGSRRRRGAPPAAIDTMPINDAEMSKAASNGAEELVKLGDDGVGIIKLIVEDYGVENVGDIPADKRQEFIEKVALEVRLAKEEYASKQA